MADRNLFTLNFLLGIAGHQAAFILREHQNLPWTALTEFKAGVLSEKRKNRTQDSYVPLSILMSLLQKFYLAAESHLDTDR